MADDSDFIFPPRVIPDLRNMRGEEWKDYIDHLIFVAPDDIDRIAFVLTIVRLAGCTTCQADSFKAMRGCTQCASQTIRRFRGDDNELLRQLDLAAKEVQVYRPDHSQDL